MGRARAPAALLAAALVSAATVASVTASTSASTTTTTLAANSTTTTPAGTLACAEEVVAAWPLPRLANETIAVSVNGLDVGAMAPAARAGYGGLLLFGTTAVARFAQIVATLQRETPGGATLLVMTDQEGGGVVRLTNLVASLPWAQVMGENLSAAQITAEGVRVGRSMMAAGVNTDLAPVLDVDGRRIPPSATDPDGLRSFGGSPGLVARDGVAFLQGLRTAGVTAVVKHFPGLGGATGNTDDAPAATRSWKDLQTTGLVPFANAVRAGASAVMIANATIPGFSALPASISPGVISYLRGRLGFGGLIVTDSLAAGALGDIGLGVPAASVRALAAGADLVLAGSPTSSAASLTLAAATSTAIQRAVAAGTLPLTTLRAAAAQVLASRSAVACPAG
jgi:beta-N-acetylhexosaminidase